MNSNKNTKNTKMNANQIQNKITEIESGVTKDDKDFVKSHTHLTNEEVSMLTKDGIECIKQLHSKGMSSENITDFISRIFKFQENKQKQEISMKIDDEIKKENFKENVSFNGKEFVYEKFVVVGSYKSVVSQKTFKTKGACNQWIRMNNKLSSKKASVKH